MTAKHEMFNKRFSLLTKVAQIEYVRQLTGSFGVAQSLKELNKFFRTYGSKK